MRYLPHTQQDIAAMLQVIGAESVEALFEQIPATLRQKVALKLPPALSEAELLEHLENLGRRNQPQQRSEGKLHFLGAGLVRHHIPACVDALSLRGEFATSYTPYQPELAQGTLLAMFEFQTAVAEFFGMEYANASMYDGASATAEAILMARRLTGRAGVLLGRGVHPEYLETCRTYLNGLSEQPTIQLLESNQDGGVSREALKKRLGPQVACVVLQNPSFLGVIEDLRDVAEMTHKAGALFVSVCTEPLALALLASPGSMGADIATGEGLGLAAPPQLGGPGVGLFACSGKKALRNMPGRIVGQTVDQSGRRGYVLTLATREQHIRREKATSNICTNHGLLALRFMIHVALLGRVGLKSLAQLNLSKAAYAAQQLCKIPGIEPYYTAPFFNEFTLRIPGRDSEALVRAAAAQGVVPGVALGRFDPQLGDGLLVAVNETHRREDLDRLAEVVEATLR